MKKILIVSLALISALPGAAFAVDSAPASNFNFTFFGNNSGRYTMVACSYAEAVAEEFMTKFGATNLEIYCTGGIQPWGIFPLNLRVEYTAPILTGETKTEKVVLESDTWSSNCDFDTRLTRALLRDFPNVKATRSSDHCFQADSRYEYELDVTTAK